MASNGPVTTYEQERQARIAANRARMEALGVGPAFEELKLLARRPQAKPRGRPAAARSPRPPKGSRLPSRRSDRNEGRAAPVYNEDVLARVDAAAGRGRGGGGGAGSARLRELCGPREEVYTQAHLDLLGSCSTEWVLKVDGYDAAGERVYDRVAGKTCHQCRQKTIGKRTRCIECQSADGVFCGDCLFMRYGENVDEALEDPAWKCFHCRDPVLCNGSICRTQRGWAPTGPAYPTAKREGYRSVAHYLIQRSLDEQAAAAKQSGGPHETTATDAAVPAADSEPSDASAQTAGGAATCSGNEHEATADGAAADAVSGGGCPSTVPRMRQQTLNVLMSQRKAGPPPGLKGSKKVGSLKALSYKLPSNNGIRKSSRGCVLAQRVSKSISVH